jgi:hypothetical protein
VTGVARFPTEAARFLLPEPARRAPRGRLGLASLLHLGRFDLQPQTLRARGGGVEAALAPRRDNRFAVLVDTEPERGWASVAGPLRTQLANHRLRFRVAHEIGHSFFYDRSQGRPRRLALNSDDQERWCDRFASALLLPPEVVLRAAPVPQAIIALHRRYDVSMHVAARAVGRMHRDRFVALLVARGERAPYVRVQWQKRHDPPAARWWTHDRLQAALRGVGMAGTAALPWPGGRRTAAWYALPARAQVVVVAQP